MSEVIFHSSGSTGDAKRIVRTEESLMADATQLVNSFPDIWSRAPVVVSTVRPEHMYGALWRVRAPAIAGSTVDPAIVTSVEELSALCAKYGKILFVTTPSFLEKALGHPDFAALKGMFVSIVTSGSLLAEETSKAIHETLGTSPFEIYGSTEAGSVAWRRRINGEEWTLCPVVNARLSSEGGLEVDSPHAMSRPFVMTDSIKFTSDRTFVLGARLDRRVKILEKYVSLSAVEKAFKSHPLVDRVRVEVCSGAVARTGALIVLLPEGLDALAKGTVGGLAARLRRDIAPLVEQAAFPRRMRFVRALPVNEQGKTTVAAVRTMLDMWCCEPAVTGWSLGANRLSAKFVFPPDMKCFDGHFPKFPVLAGVAQLYFIRHFARQAFSSFPDACILRQLKFQKVIFPGTEVSLQIDKKSDDSWSFSLVGLQGPCASGIWERKNR